jgi:hypothetical protein
MQTQTWMAANTNYIAISGIKSGYTPTITRFFFCKISVTVFSEDISNDRAGKFYSVQYSQLGVYLLILQSLPMGSGGCKFQRYPLLISFFSMYRVCLDWALTRIVAKILAQDSAAIRSPTDWHKMHWHAQASLSSPNNWSPTKQQQNFTVCQYFGWRSHRTKRTQFPRQRRAIRPNMNATSTTHILIKPSNWTCDITLFQQELTSGEQTINHTLQAIHS